MADHVHELDLSCPYCDGVTYVVGHSDNSMLGEPLSSLGPRGKVSSGMLSTVPDELAGKELMCRSCYASMTIPTPYGPQTVQVSGTDSEEVASVAKRLIGQIHDERERVRPMTTADTEAAGKREHDREQLELQKLRLEREYELAKMGLGLSGTASSLGAGSVLIIMMLGFGATMWGTRTFLSGTQMVAIVVVVAIGLVAFAAMVFGRAARLKARISKTEKELEMVLGDDVRR